MPTGGVDFLAGAGALASVFGEAAPIVGLGLAGAETGAGIGGITSAITGGNIGQGILHGAEAGGLTGGGIGIGGEIAGGLGAGAGSLGAIAGSGLGGAAGGALGGVATGGNPVLGALEGGVAGGISGSGILNSSSGTSTDATGTPNPTGQPSGVPASAQSAGNLGGGTSGAGGGAAPSGVTPDYGLPPGSQDLYPSSVSSGTPLSSVGSLVTNSGNFGTGNVGSNLSSGVNSQTDSLLNSFAQEQGAAAPVTDSLSPSVISASNAASPTGTDISLQQPSTFANLTGGTSPIDQSVSPSLASAGNAASGGAAAKAPNSIGELFQPGGFTLGNVGTALANNIAPLAAAGGIGLDALKGNKQSGAEKNITAQAGQESAQGQQLENYLQTGTLPAGMQAGVNQNLQSTIASIKSRYASMGMSGSSAEAQDIANAQSQAQAASAQMQEQLLSTGIQETGMSSQLYSELLKNSMANDTNLSNAIASFAAAASGGGDFGKGGSYHLVQG